METLVKCWKGCLPTCLRPPKCPCLRRHRNRVAASRPIKVITAISFRDDRKGSNGHSSPGKLNGETNLNFEGDQVSFRPGSASLDNTDGLRNVPNGNGRSPSNGTLPNGSGPGTSTSILPDTELAKAYFQFLNTVYLELDKEKQVRVVHISAPPLEQSPSKRSRRTSPERETLDAGHSSSSDDEEYWFTRWNRRPKLKNVFVPKPEAKEGEGRARIDVTVELNSKFKYEEVEEEKDESDRMSIKSLFRQSSVTSLISKVAQPSSRPTSQNDANAKPNYSSKDEIEMRRGACDSLTNNRSEPRNGHLELPVNEGLVAESGDNNNHVNESVPTATSFTNFAFQSDTEDEDVVEENPEPESQLESSKTDEEEWKHFETDIHAATERARRPSDPSALSQVKLHELLERAESMTSLAHERNYCDKGTNDPDKASPVPSKPIIFLIHGISGSSDIWKSQFEYFHENGYEILAPDLVGHGLSSTPNIPAYYLFESLVQDLASIFDHFVSEERQTVVVGHGYGACLGTVLSRIRPNVCLLISVSGGGPTPIVPAGSFETPFFRFNLFAKKRRTGRFDNPDLRNVIPVRIHDHLLDGQLWVDGDAAFHRRVLVPTLLVYGMRDKVVSLIEECEMERTIPRAFLEIIPTAGHMVMWDEPKKFNRMLIKFIQTWT